MYCDSPTLKIKIYFSLPNAFARMLKLAHEDLLRRYASRPDVRDITGFLPEEVVALDQVEGGFVEIAVGFSATATPHHLASYLAQGKASSVYYLTTTWNQASTLLQAFSTQNP